MRKALLGLSVGAMLMVANATIVWNQSNAYAQRPELRTSTGPLTVIQIGGSDQLKQLAIVDQNARAIGVYHVHPTSGELSLKSVRNINWDLRLDEFNSVNPSTREIRALLRRR